LREHSNKLSELIIRRVVLKLPIKAHQWAAKQQNGTEDSMGIDKFLTSGPRPSKLESIAILRSSKTKNVNRLYLKSCRRFKC